MSPLIEALTAMLCVPSPIQEARPEASYAHKVRLSAIMMVESSGNPNALSPAGAMGPMQLMPITIRELQTAADVPPECRPHKEWNKDVFTFKWGVHWGACYVELLERRGFVGIETLIGYNAGPSRAREWRRTGRMPAETREYIRRVTELESVCLKEATK